MPLAMVDRAFPPNAAEMDFLKNKGIACIAGYCGGVNNGGRAWTPADAARVRAAGFLFLPIYVGENASPGCKVPMVLTRAQGAADGVDAVACARRFGCTSGPLCLDVEYDTYTANVAGALAYMEAWSFAVATGGFLPVLYAILQTATDYQPQAGHPTGLWIADWDGAGNLAVFPNAARFTGVGWQYADNWNGWDISHVDGAWWDASFQQVPPADPPLPTPDLETWRDPATGYIVGGGFLARFKQLQQALASIDPNEVLMVVGHPTSNEYQLPTGATRQDFEHVTFTWVKGASPQRFDVLEAIVNPFDASKGK